MKSANPRKKPGCRPYGDTTLDENLLANRLLTCKQVEIMTGLARRTRRVMENQQQFPLPIKVSNKIRLYPCKAVMAWIDAEKAAVHP